MTFAARQNENLGVWLQAVGYRTGFVGKVMNGYKGADTRPLPGWDDWRGLLTPSDSDGGHYYDYVMNENGLNISYGHDESDYLTDVITRKATAFIEQSAALRQPFFLYVGHHAPHEPAIPAVRHDGVFEGRNMPRRPNFNELNVADKPRFVGINVRVDEVVKQEVAQLYRDRLETLLAVDDGVRDILDALKRSRQLDNTYLIFTSYNGFMLGEHRFANSKNYIYEESIRVPLLIRGPDLPRGVNVTQLVNNLDLVATLTDLSGASPANALDGASLLPLMLDPSTPWRTALLVEGRIGVGKDEDTTYSAIRTPAAVYVEYQSSRLGKEYEYYDLVADPHQLSNLGVDRARYQRFQPVLERLRSCVGRECWIGNNPSSARRSNSLR